MNSEETGLWASGLNPPDDIEFLAPGRLWWLLVVAALAVAYMIMQLLRRRVAVRFTNVELLDAIAPDRPDWKRHVAALFMIAGMFLGVLAYAEPASVTEVPSERATVILAIDTSLSMQATDMDPDRISGAKVAANAFVDEVPEQINIGLVSFNGIANVRVPPTTNRAAMRAAIDSLDLGEATATGEAILASLEAIEDFIIEFDGEAPPARIVLMSDGERTVGRENAVAVEAARAAGVPVSTIAFGTDDATIEIPEFPDPIPVPVNEEALAEIADQTGGEFFEADTTEELTAVYTDIGSAVATSETEILVGSWFSGRAMLAMVIAAALALWTTSRFP